jgi:hypothetical protein
MENTTIISDPERAIAFSRCIESSFNTLLNVARIRGFALPQIMGMGYFPDPNLTEEFVAVCHKIVECLEKHGKDESEAQIEG